MGLEFNADKEYLKSDNPQLIGSENIIFRSGAGASEKEIFRAKLDPATNLPRLGVNRTGDRVDKVNIVNQGSGYTAAPTVIIGPPDSSTNPVQATGSALLSNGRVIGVQITNGGGGYTTAPSITFQNAAGDTTGGGAQGTTVLDTIEYEIDVNGAIRTSTSIISDTARILNLDFQNVVTPNFDLRSPRLKVWDNSFGQQWTANTSLSKGDFRYYEQNVYRAKQSGITGTNPPLHLTGSVTNGNLQLEHVGYRADDALLPGYDSFSWPESITPPLGDNSSKIATTEYVLNLATNDVGGRVYVSQQIGDDENDGRSPASPVRTIKRGCQIATESRNVKETVIVAGGDYTEDNPISIPPDCAVVGDSLRIVLVRPNNPGKHMFKFADKNYISGLTFRDKLDSQGNPLSTWQFACVFDDKQRIYYDSTTGGDFKRRFPVGHQIFGKNKFRADFDFNTGLSSLSIGETIIGVNSTAIGTVIAVNYTSTTGPQAYQKGTVDFDIVSGNFAKGETVRYYIEAPVEYTGWPSSPSIGDPYTHPTDGVTYIWNGTDWAQEFQFTATTLISIRPEGEVVEHGTDVTTTVPIIRVDASQQATYGGLILYTNELVGIDNIHDFHEGMEIFISGMPDGSVPGDPDLSFLNGYQRIYDLDKTGVPIDDDSRSRRFVIPKDNLPSLTDSNIIVDATASAVSHYVTLSLLNSPNKFEETPYVSRRYQDARNLIRNNLEFIKDETYKQIIAEFTHFINPSESKCRRDIGHFVNAIIRDMEYGGNYHTVEAAKYYVIGTGIGYIATELSETVRAFDIARDLAVLAMRGWRINQAGDLYNPQFSTIDRFFDPDVTIDSSWPYCANVEAAINTLTDLFIAIITNNQIDRYVEAGYLIARNQDFIIQETSRYIEDQYPELFLSENASAARYKDSTNLIRNNRQEIIDRAAAEIAIQHPDFYYPGDAQTTNTSRYKDSYRLIQLNRQEIIDRAAAEIAVQHPDFYYPGDAQTTSISRFKDSYRLIQLNRAAIIDTAYAASGGSIPGDTNGEKCKRDIGYFIDAVSLDIAQGAGNRYSRKFIQQYFNQAGTAWISNGLQGEEIQSNLAFNSARDEMKKAITNQLGVKDLTITADPATGSNTSTSSCADVQSAIDTLTAIITARITAGNLTGLPAETTGTDPAGEAKCKRDIGHFIDAVSLDIVQGGGNRYSRKFIQQYFVNATTPISNGLVGEEAQSVTAFNMARDMMNKALTNQLYTKDLTISAGPATYGGGGGNIAVLPSGNAASCTDVQSAVSSLTTLITDRITAGNLTGLPAETTGTVPAGEAKCKRDIGYIVDAVASDLYDGSNVNIIRATKRYFLANTTPLSNGLVGETSQSVTAFNKARDIMKRAVTNQLYSKDLTITGDPDPGNTPPPYGTEGVTTNNTNELSCTDVQTSISTLISVITTAISAGNLNSLPTENTGDFLTTTSIKCRRDIGYILGALRRDLILGGNAGIVTAGESYYTGTALTGIPSNELTPTREAFVKARDLAILAMRNWNTGNGAYSQPDYVPEYATTIQFIDPTVIEDTSTPTCANVASAITTSFGILDSILADGSTQTKTYGTLYEPTVTYPENTIYDADNKRITIESIWADLPFIEASPYIQNASVISFLGGGGCEIDGDKIRQPNCPRPGLNPAVGNNAPKATYPNQGKSMVAAQFTIISFGGIGYKIVNDGYTQLVSVFVLFAQDGVYADTGGYASITNSATNFGTYALRARGFRKDPYVFDIGTISNVTTTATGRTVFTVGGLGREPLEHYIVKFADYENQDSEIEYFVENVRQTSAGATDITSTIDLNDAILIQRKSDGQPVVVNNAELVGKQIRLHRPSIVNSSSHTWEYAGSGNDYNALPENGGVKNEALEQVSQAYGRVYTSGTDELGDFKVGYFAKIENRTGNITFTGTVSISEVEFLKLKGGDVVVTGFDASNTLGGNFSTDSKIPTQKAVKDYISNNLGQYINKPYSTNAVPRNLVELTDSGKISLDQIPALRPFSVYTIADEDARLALEGPLAGDIAIQQDTSQSFILNNDLDSQFLGITVNEDYDFPVGELVAGSISTGQGEITEYRFGVVYQISITDQGDGYDAQNPPSVSFSAPQQAGGVTVAASATIANSKLVAITIVEYDNLVGGKGYTSAPTVTISAPGAGGTQAEATALIESRVYTNIVNNIKITDTDNISDYATPTNNVAVIRTVNTSASDPNNWVSLSSTTTPVTNLTGPGTISPNLLGSSGSANSTTFLRGDSTFAPAVQSIKASENRYFAYTADQAAANQNIIQVPLNSAILLGHVVVADGIPADTTVQNTFVQEGKTVITLSTAITQIIPIDTLIEFVRPASPVVISSTFTLSGFIDTVYVSGRGTGYTDGTYYDVALTGGVGTGLKGNIVVSSGQLQEVIVTSGGTGYTSDFSITSIPAAVGPGTGGVLEAKVNTTVKNFSNVGVDILRVDDKTLAAQEFGNVGVARFFKSQFEIGLAGNGSVKLKTGADSGLDADLLDGQQGNYYLNGQNFANLSITPDKLASGTYGIDISGQSGNTLRLTTSVGNASSSPSPSTFNEGITADTRNNTADGLSDGGTKHGVITYRQFGTGSDSSGGGVRQLAFTDNNNLWIRGSGSGVTGAFSTWAKLWSSINQGADSGLDADKLDGRQGVFYQNAFNINKGNIGSSHIATYLRSTGFNNTLKVSSFVGQVFYDVYVTGQVLSEAPYVENATINLYDTSGIEVGEFVITSIVTNNSLDDALDYTILTGRLTAGSFNSAAKIGTPSNNVFIADYNITDIISNSTYTVAELGNFASKPLLKLGRTDGTASSPAIYFNSASSPATFNVKLEASGGTGTEGSGLLNIVANNANAVTINNSTIWNSGNIQFASANTASTAVQRDSNGDFSAGTITASLTGAASLNVLKSGDTMSGNLTFSAGNGIVINTSANSLATGTGNRNLTILNETGGADAYLTFHVSGDYAGYFGLDGSTNDLFWGGWSVGSSTKYTILHTGNNLPATTNTANTLVKRDSNGDFAAGTITAALSGNASTATKLQTARLINGTSFDGSANITITSNTPNSLSVGTYLQFGDGSGTQSFNGGAARTINVIASTSGNTNLVARDASGNFSAGTITATLSGNASTATKATNIAGGASNNLVYQSGTDSTSFLAAGTAGYFLKQGSTAPEWTAFPIGGSNQEIQYNNNGALAASAQFKFESATHSIVRLGDAASLRQTSNATLGSVGASEGLIQYHSNRWYVNVGSSGAEVVRFRAGTTDVAWIGTGGAFNCNGAITAGGDITAFSSSDNRLKTNIEPIENALNKVGKISGVTYNWNEKAEDKDQTKRESGVIAQEILEVLPEVVVERDNGYLAVQYERLIPLLIEAIKELKQEVETLKASK